MKKKVNIFTQYTKEQSKQTGSPGYYLSLSGSSLWRCSMIPVISVRNFGEFLQKRRRKDG